jgi:uncharacterized protein
MAPIEVEPERIADLLERAAGVHARLREAGFTFVAMDLAGYRRGSLNEGQPLIQISTLGAPGR